jgi:hypothetical protein
MVHNFFYMNSFFVTIISFSTINRAISAVLYCMGVHLSCNDYLTAFLKELRNRGYAMNTIRTYHSGLACLLEAYTSQEVRRIAWSAIKLFYELVLISLAPTRWTRSVPDTGSLLF